MLAALKRSRAQPQESQRAVGGQVSTPGGLACCVDQSETQHKSSSLERAWVIGEENLLTNFGTCAGGAGNYRSFLQCRGVLTGTIFLALFLPSWLYFCESQF